MQTGSEIEIKVIYVNMSYVYNCLIPYACFLHIFRKTVKKITKSIAPDNKKFRVAPNIPKCSIIGQNDYAGLISGIYGYPQYSRALIHL